MGITVRKLDCRVVRDPKIKQPTRGKGQACTTMGPRQVFENIVSFHKPSGGISPRKSKREKEELSIE